MKIIQSYSKFEEGSPYIINEQNKSILKFYSFLLSYITLKQHCGKVTMYCNNDAYESLIKYIPYDDVVIMENTNSFQYWNLYKLDVMRKIDGKFLHIDSDIFIFNEDFMNQFKGKWDVVVQNISSSYLNPVEDFTINHRNYIQNKLKLNIIEGDNKSTCCGVFGYSDRFKEHYYRCVDTLYNDLINGNITNIISPNIVVEELMVYLVASALKYKIIEILPHDLIEKYGINEVGNIKKYTHLWLSSKYEKENVILIKNKIKGDYPQYYKYIDIYENTYGKSLHFLNDK